jgi:putative ABC transport system ATP-binding protein|tara:strand:+ start:174 stop:863 length:690 start_codon:yes stop_codon:yes gene_type:complete
MNREIISLKNLSKSYNIAGKPFYALKEINLSFGEGEFTGIVGPSGSGKTTLLNIIGSLDSPSSGEAIVLEKNISSLNHSESARLRNYNIGFIFQVFNLLPVYTVYENVEFALLLQNFSQNERKKLVLQALKWVGLENHKDKKPDKLSGGESQRVAIARAIVKKPKILLADEPTANLDAENAHSILKTMKKINKELGTTFIFSTHDEKVMKYLNRTIILKDGNIEKETKK